MKNKRAFYLLLSANAVSQFAQGISMIAIPWYFINQLKLSTFYNWVFLLTTLVTFFWAPIAGTIIDRYSRKTIFQILCLVGAVVLFIASSTGYMQGRIPMALIVMVFAFTVLNYNIHYPSLYALSQEISEGSFYGKVNSYLEVQGQATSMLSGAGAAILISGVNSTYHFFGVEWHFYIEKWSLHQIFLMDGITYMVAFTLLFFMQYIAVKEKKVETGAFITRLKNGWKYLRQNPLIFRFGLFTYFVFVTVIVHVFYLLHLYVSDHLGGTGRTLAISQIFHTVGALSAGMLTRILFKRLHTAYAALILMFTIITLYFIIGLNTQYFIFWVACMFVGFCNSGIRILRVTFIFQHVPNESIGRVTSVFQSANIFLRLFLISIFHQIVFVENPDYSYLVNSAFIALAIIPVLWKLKEIVRQYS